MAKSKTPNLANIPNMNAGANDLYDDQDDMEHSLSLYDSDQYLPAVVHQDPWDDLDIVALNEDFLCANRITGGNSTRSKDAPFDVLRTRLLRILKEKNWRRVAITSPTAGCGKSFVSANLALSLSRLDSVRTILLDMNLRDPGLGDNFGITHSKTMREYLSGEVIEKNFLFRVNENLALGLNKQPEESAAELLQSPKTHEVLEIMNLELNPDIVLYDMPSVLLRDDVLSFLPQVDGVLLVIGGGKSTADEVRQVEKLLAGQVPLLGVILNRDEG